MPPERPQTPQQTRAGQAPPEKPLNVILSDLTGTLHKGARDWQDAIWIIQERVQHEPELLAATIANMEAKTRPLPTPEKTNVLPFPNLRDARS
jgi:hypothetical protein